MNTTDDFHCFRSDRVAHWQGIAETLETTPSAWGWALANIERWLAQGGLHPGPLLEWRQSLLESCDEPTKRNVLISALRHPPANAHEDQLRSCPRLLEALSGGQF